MSKCTNCHTDIEFNYCSRCGKKYIGKRLGLLTLGWDMLDNFFAMDNSFVSQIWQMLKDPKKIIHDYWNGYRRFYFSPGRFLLIATIFLGFNFLLKENEFLGATISSSSTFLSSTMAFFLLLVPILTLSSMLAYLGLKKNFYEHLVLNLYNFSLWTILFSTLSILLHKTELDLFNLGFQAFFFLLVVIWNARSFKIKPIEMILRFFLNVVLFGAIMYGLVVWGEWHNTVVVQ